MKVLTEYWTGSSRGSFSGQRIASLYCTSSGLHGHFGVQEGFRLQTRGSLVTVHCHVARCWTPPDFCWLEITHRRATEDFLGTQNTRRRERYLGNHWIPVWTPIFHCTPGDYRQITPIPDHDGWNLEFKLAQL